MKGIYRFVNNTNGKVYVGQSIHVETRYKHHRANYTNPSCSMYNGKLYRAFRKYGFDSFSFEVLEESGDFTQQDLNEKEVYYISYYNSYEKGYNMNYGGQYTSNMHKKLTVEQILQIKDEIKNTNHTFQDISAKYGLDSSGSLISMMNKGIVWQMIGNYNYPLREDTFIHNKGGSNPMAVFSDEEVMEIRERFVTETMPDIYQDYKTKCSFSELKKIIYGSQFKNLPYYKKRQKQWYLNETCIDYPRVEE